MKKKGFNLIEVIVAMVILSLIVVIFYTTWWLGMKASGRSKEIAQKYMGARVFLNFLEKELRSAFEFDYPGYDNFVWDPKEKRLEFWGVAPDEVRMVYPHPFPIHRTIYYLKQENGNNVLYKKVIPFFAEKTKGQYQEVEGPVLEGDFEFNIEIEKSKIKSRLPGKVKISLIIDEKHILEKVVYIDEFKKANY